MSRSEVRKNRLWVAIIHGESREEGYFGLVNGRLVKFTLPEVDKLSNRPFENTKQNAIWYFLNRLDGFATTSDDRVINADDISPESLLALIPWHYSEFPKQPEDHSFLSKGELDKLLSLYKMEWFRKFVQGLHEGREGGADWLSWVGEGISRVSVGHLITTNGMTLSELFSVIRKESIPYTEDEKAWRDCMRTFYESLDRTVVEALKEFVNDELKGHEISSGTYNPIEVSEEEKIIEMNSF